MIKTFAGGRGRAGRRQRRDAETYAIQAGHLIVDAAQPARGPSTVIVENGRISRIDNGFTAPAGAIMVDERSRTVMPGMTDVHVHLNQNGRNALVLQLTRSNIRSPYATTLGLTHALEMARAGFTTVRDLGGDTAGGHRCPRRGRRRPLSRARGSRCPAIRCRSSAATPTMPPAFRPSSPGRSTTRTSAPRSAPASTECQEVVRKLAAARRRRDQDHGHRRRARSRARWASSSISPTPK